MQVDPIKSTLKAPGTKRLKLQYGETGFNFWFQFQLAPLQHGERGDAGRHCGADGHSAVRRHGWAVQVDAMKPTLKAPGAERLKLGCDDLLSTFAFNFNLRRDATDTMLTAKVHRLCVVDLQAGDYPRPLFMGYVSTFYGIRWVALVDMWVITRRKLNRNRLTDRDGLG